MSQRRFFLLLLALTPAVAQNKNAAEQLGHPADTKLLDHPCGRPGGQPLRGPASFAALDQRAATAASIMTPCPWLTEVAEYAKTHPDADLGLHLTLTSEWKAYR